jgi:hypothetical protein
MKLLCVSTSKNTDSILKKIVEFSKGAVQVGLHVGSKDSDLKASSFSRMITKVTKKNPQTLIQNSKFSGDAHLLFDCPDFDENFSLFMDHLNRGSDHAKFKSHQLKSIYDYLDYYHILHDFFVDMVHDKKITHMLFFNVPHLTYDTLFYQIAKQLNIPTLIVTQSLVANKFYSLQSIEDYGNFLLDQNQSSNFKIKAKAEELFYMSKVKQGQRSRGSLNFMSIVNILTYIILKKPFNIVNPLYLYRTFDKARSLTRQLPKWRDPFGSFFTGSSFTYFEHILQYEEKEVDLNQRFIYFPLHLQPEMTTSSLGGAFKDQALAIERLSSMLPEGVKIYVKENPKQAGGYMRGPMFFYRLNRLSNVEFLPSYTSTHELLDQSEFVATITGTVGWEALQKAKNVLIFGNTWYQNFPGVFQYEPSLTYEKILNYTIDISTVEHAAGQLIEASHTGVIDRHYTQLVDNFNRESNDNDAAQTILNLILKKEKFTFI